MTTGAGTHVTASTTIALDWSESQQVFRAVLDSMSHPGTLRRLPCCRNAPPAVLMPALALADVEVGVHVLGPQSQEWEEALRTATGARPVGLAEASIVTALEAPTALAVQTLRRGSALHPEEGGRLVIACSTLREGVWPAADATTMALRGPGIASAGRVLTVSPLARDVISALQAANSAFPAGVDVHFVTPAGDIASLPRSTTIEMLEI